MSGPEGVWFREVPLYFQVFTVWTQSSGETISTYSNNWQFEVLKWWSFNCCCIRKQIEILSYSFTTRVVQTMKL